MSVEDLKEALKTAAPLETAEGVTGKNNVYLDPPGSVEPLPLLAHTTGVVDAAKESRENMVSRLFNHAKPSDLRKGIERDAPAAQEDETLTDKVHRVIGHR